MRIGAQDPGAAILARAQLGADPASKAEALAASADRRPAHEVAQKMEALFGTLLVKEMRGTQSTALFGEGTSADVYGGWFDQFVGEVLAHRGALHLTEAVERSLARKEALGR